MSYNYKPIDDRIICKDGASVSVQASKGHYCTPRTDHGPWSHIEAGYPSVNPPDSWADYSEEWHSLTTRQLIKDVRQDLRYAWVSFKGRKFRMNFSTRHHLRSAWTRIRGLKPTDTIYAYMPIELVDEFITAHGGKIERASNDDPPKGYMDCQRCGDPTWNIELGQCHECGFTD